jgi:glycosyltransferase involved in cell wall biosynthesis
VRVLHLIKTAGGGTWALRQIRELVRLGVEAHVALPLGGPMVGRYTDVGAVEHLLQTDFPIRAPWRFPALKKRFSELLKIVQPDIIHSHFVGTTLSMRLALGRGNTLPRVFQVPGPLHLEHAFFRQAELASAGAADFWIGSCRWTCKRYEKSGISHRRIFLSYYGTDIDTYAPKKHGKLRNELGLGTECKIVGMVAFMYAPKRILGQRRGLKGHEDLIDAFKICLAKNPDLRCVIVGGAWNKATKYESALHKYARQQCGDRVIFLGTRYDVPDLYADFDVAVHPSLSENVGGAVESLLLGIPTIATRVGGFPDLVRDGETGWLISPKNPHALAKAIQDALNDPTESHKRAKVGQQRARDLFDVRKSANEVKNIYEQILDQTL